MPINLSETREFLRQLKSQLKSDIVAGNENEIQFKENGVLSASNKLRFDSTNTHLNIGGSPFINNTAQLPTLQIGEIYRFYETDTYTCGNFTNGAYGYNGDQNIATYVVAGQYATAYSQASGQHQWYTDSNPGSLPVETTTVNEGAKYIITSAGGNFDTFGAADNNIDTVFEATSSGTASGGGVVQILNLKRRATLDAQGRFILGRTSSPFHKFEVALKPTPSSTTITETADFVDVFSISNYPDGGVGTNFGDRIPLVFNVGGSLSNNITAAIVGHRGTASNWDSELSFWVNNKFEGPSNTDTIQERMRLDSDGNLLLNHTSTATRYTETGATLYSGDLDQTSPGGGFVFNHMTGVSNGALIGNKTGVNPDAVADRGSQLGLGNNDTTTDENIAGALVFQKDDQLTTSYIVGVNKSRSSRQGHLVFGTSDGAGPLEKMRIDNDGNVLIGIVSSTPAKLNIGKDTSTAYANVAPNIGDFGLVISNNENHVSGGVFSGLQFNQTGDSQNRITYIGAITEDTNQHSSLVFGTDSGGSGRTEKMRITSDGNVGIGEANPIDHRLTVKEDRRGNEPAYGALHLSSIATTLEDRVGIVFNQTGVSGRARASIMATAEEAAGYGSALSFFTRYQLDGTALQTSDERMRITSAGNVVIKEGQLQLENDTNGFISGGSGRIKITGKDNTDKFLEFGLSEGGTGSGILNTAGAAINAVESGVDGIGLTLQANGGPLYIGGIGGNQTIASIQTGTVTSSIQYVQIGGNYVIHSTDSSGGVVADRGDISKNMYFDGTYWKRTNNLSPVAITTTGGNFLIRTNSFGGGFPAGETTSLTQNHKYRIITAGDNGDYISYGATDGNVGTVFYSNTTTTVSSGAVVEILDLQETFKVGKDGLTTFTRDSASITYNTDINNTLRITNNNGTAGNFNTISFNNGSTDTAYIIAKYNRSGNNDSDLLFSTRNSAGGAAIDMRINSDNTTSKVIIGRDNEVDGSKGNALIAVAYPTGNNIAGGNMLIRGGTSTGSALGGYISFSTAPAGSSGSTPNSEVERMRITSAGNVGIGAESPLLKLHIQGDVSGGSYNQAVGQVVISGDTNTNKRLNIGFDTSTDTGFLQAGINGTGYNDLLLNPNGGNVGIGVSDPISRLEINNSFAMRAVSIASVKRNFLKNVQGTGVVNALQVSIPAEEVFVFIKLKFSGSRAITAAGDQGTSTVGEYYYAIGRNGSGSDVVLDNNVGSQNWSAATTSAGGGANTQISPATTIVRNGSEANTAAQLVNITLDVQIVGGSTGNYLCDFEVMISENGAGGGVTFL